MPKGQTYDQGQEFEDGLALLLLRIVARGAQNPLREVLRGDEAHWQHQVADGVMPAQRGRPILKVE